MLDYVRELLNDQSFAPHGYCLLWQPELIWTHVISDALIGASYFSIPVALAYFLTKRRDVQFGWVVWMFAIFIMHAASPTSSPFGRSGTPITGLRRS